MLAFAASSQKSGIVVSAKRWSAVDLAVGTLGLISLCFSFWAVSVGWHNSIFDFYGYRQSQTALTAESILHGGPVLRYETPVLGPPWSIPFEFPLYQLLVALFARTFSTPLDQAGRFVSVFFYYLSFWPLAAILAKLRYRRLQIATALALFAASPFYVVVSRFFMIESTALFFSLLYLDQLLGATQSGTAGENPGRSRYIAGAAIFGVIAGIVKVTTFAPFFGLGACLAAFSFWKELRAGILQPKLVASVFAFCLLLPVLATARWTKFADSVKSHNPYGVDLTSKALKSWNFGTLSQRLDPKSYVELLSTLHSVVGSTLLAVAVALVAVWLCPRKLPAAGICFLLYAGTIETFFHLYSWHMYYTYASGIFVVAAVAILVGEVQTLPGWRAWLGVFLLAALLLGCGQRYFSFLYPIQRQNAPGWPKVASILDRTTRSNEIVLVTGLEWNSDLPYQSHRRAIMEADEKSHRFDQPIANTGAENIGAVVACNEGRADAEIPSLLHRLSMGNSPIAHADECDIYERDQMNRAGQGGAR